MSLLSRLAPGALVGAALLASSFLGSSVSVSVRDRLEGVRDTPTMEIGRASCRERV